MSCVKIINDTKYMHKGYHLGDNRYIVRASEWLTLCNLDRVDLFEEEDDRGWKWYSVKFIPHHYDEEGWEIDAHWEVWYHGQAKANDGGRCDGTCDYEEYYGTFSQCAKYLGLDKRKLSRMLIKGVSRLINTYDPYIRTAL